MGKEKAIRRGRQMSLEEHMELLLQTNRDYYENHESILLAKQVIEKQKKAHHAGKQE